MAVSPPPQGQAVAEQDGAAQPEESPTAKFFETIKVFQLIYDISLV